VNNNREILRGKREDRGFSIERKEGSSFGGYFLAFFSGGVLTAVCFFVFGNVLKQKQNDYLETLSFGTAKCFGDAAIVSKSQQIECLDQLLAMTDEELEQVDVALMNLLCAEEIGCTT